MAKLRSPIFWILILAAVLRFVQIDSPPVGRHAWRQSDTAGVARNFLRYDHGFLYPQIDWEIPGFVEMELPIYPWTASLIYRVSGETEAAARMLSIVGSLLTIWFLYLLVLRLLGRRTAAWAAFFYAILPLSLFFGRAIMPESWMLAATAAAIYAFLRWTDEDSWFFFGLAAVATALACLLKLTSLYIGLPLLWLAWQRWGGRTLAQWRIWLFGALVIGSLAAWYGHAYQLGQDYGASFHILTAAGTDKWGNWGLLADPDFYHQVFVGNLGGRMLTWAGFPVLIVGLFLPRLAQRERLFDVWLLAVVIVLLLASGGSYQHDYYSLPILLPAVVFMGKVFDRGWERGKVPLALFAALIVILSSYRAWGTLAEERIENLDKKIATILATASSPSDLVISCNGSNPTWLYLADRRGWGRDCSTLGKSELEALRSHGATLLVGLEPGSPLAPTPALASYLTLFHDQLTDYEPVLAVNLADSREFDDLSWEVLTRTTFSGDSDLERWILGNGRWELSEDALSGSSDEKAARATLSEPDLSCGTCWLRLDLELSPPVDRRTDKARKQTQRRAKRAQARVSIRLWDSQSGSGLVVTLDARGDSLRLQQFEDNASLSASAVDLPIDEGELYELELRSDAFELTLFLDGKEVMVERNRLSRAVAGSLRLQAQNGGIVLHNFEALGPSGI